MVEQTGKNQKSDNSLVKSETEINDLMMNEITRLQMGANQFEAKEDRIKLILSLVEPPNKWQKYNICQLEKIKQKAIKNQ